MNSDRRNSVSWLGWLPFLYLLGLVVSPNLIVLGLSFLTRDYSGGVIGTLSVEAWRGIVEFDNLRILWRSVMVSCGVTVACLVVCYPAAIALMQCSAKSRQIILVFVAFPMFISLLLRIYGWTNVLPSTWRGSLSTVALVMAANYLPFMLLPIVRALEGIDPTLEDAAMDLGATPLKTMWLITIPLSLPGIIAGAALVFVPALGEYLVPHFLGNGKVTVLGTQIVYEFMERRNWPFSSALACTLLLLILLAVGLSVLTRSSRYSGEDRAQ